MLGVTFCPNISQFPFHILGVMSFDNYMTYIELSMQTRRLCMQRNFDGKFLNTIKSMFLKSSSRVKWNGKISKPIKNRYGVMQGGGGVS